MLRLQVGDQVADVTKPISRLPRRCAYSSALCAGLLPSMSSPTSWRRAPRRCSASSARRPVKWPFSKSTSQASPSSSGERSRPVRIVCSAETKSMFGQHEARLDARDVQRLRADGADAARAAGRHQRVPDRLGGSRAHPQLIAQIAGEAGARHRQRLRADRETADLERLAAARRRRVRRPSARRRRSAPARRAPRSPR